jgi:hypothetical protein
MEDWGFLLGTWELACTLVLQREKTGTWMVSSARCRDPSQGPRVRQQGSNPNTKTSLPDMPVGILMAAGTCLGVFMGGRGRVEKKAGRRKEIKDNKRSAF